MSYCQLLGIAPRWDDIRETDLTPVQAACELASPLIAGMPMGKRAKLEAIVARAFPGPRNGLTTEDPLFSFLMHKHQEAGRAIGTARLRLHTNPAVFMGDYWVPRNAQLGAHEWTEFLNGIYAAYVTSEATDTTPDTVVRASTMLLHGSAHWVTDFLMVDHSEGLTARQLRQRIRNEMLAAANQFHQSLH